MNDHPFSAELRNFIVHYIDSVESLEVLLLLQKDPSRDWSVAEVTTSLRSSASSIAKRLDHFISLKIVCRQAGREDRYYFCPASEELGRYSNWLAESYSKFRLRIIEEIYRPPRSIQTFADAFKIKTEDDDHG